VSDKAQRTIRIKWVRSGIGFSYRQKQIVRSLGLRKLNQEIEKPDTPQIRGLVAKVPHLVEIVEAPPQAAWTLVPEYTIYPPAVAPSKPAETGLEALGDEVKGQAELSPAPPAEGKESGAEATGEATAVPAVSAPVEGAVGAEAAPGPAAATKLSESPAPKGEGSAEPSEGASPKKKGRRKA